MMPNFRSQPTGQGHALTLSLLGKYLALAFAGDIRQRDQIDWAEADAETKGWPCFPRHRRL